MTVSLILTAISRKLFMCNKMLGIMKRTFSYMDKEVLVTLYKTIIRPILEYGNVIWHPMFKRQSIALEKVQRRATRLVPELKDLEYSDRLRQLDLYSLKYRRYRGDMIQVYKFINKLDDVDPTNFFTTNNFKLFNTTRNSDTNRIARYSRTNTRKNSFSTRVVKGWNALSNSTKTAKDLNNFKILLDQDSKALITKFDFDE